MGSSFVPGNVFSRPEVDSDSGQLPADHLALQFANDPFVIAQNHEAAEDILEFTNVARPMVVNQRLFQRARKRRRFRGTFGNQELGQRSDILTPFA